MSAAAIWGCDTFFHATSVLEQTELDLRDEYYFSSPPSVITDEEKRAGKFKIFLSDMLDKYCETYLHSDPYTDLPLFYGTFFVPPTDLLDRQVAVFTEHVPAERAAHAVLPKAPPRPKGDPPKVPPKAPPRPKYDPPAPPSPSV